MNYIVVGCPCESGVIYGFGNASDVGSVGLGNGGSIVGSF